MNSARRHQVRKLVYGGLVVALLIPLYWISQPETTESPGGKLAQLRQANNLGQSDLGEIDPTSETIRLATLGMRGVAADILWEKLHHYRKIEDWSGVKATAEQIIKLQPHFFKVWEFQAHNLSYNISVEFDDYRDRYAWVLEGLKFLEKGARYNKTNPRFMEMTGWHLGQKIGRSDERKQYREMFKKDDDYHGDRHPSRRDCWLVSFEKFDVAEKMVDGGIPLGVLRSPVLFFSHSSKALINYAENLETDGHFGEQTKAAWRDATAAYSRFSRRELDTTRHIKIRLADLERYEQEARDMAAALDKLQPGLRAQIAAEKRAKLPGEQRAALDTPPERRTPDQVNLANAATGALFVSHSEVALRINDPAVAEEARDLADKAHQAEELADIIHSQRGIVNYDYWKARNEAGMTDEWQAALQLMVDARKKLYTDWEVAEKLYDEGFRKWSAAFDKFPKLRTDPITAREMAEHIINYKKALEQDGKTLPDDFVLKDVMELTPEQEGFSPEDRGAVQEVAPRQPERHEEGVLAPQSADDPQPASASTTE